MAELGDPGRASRLVDGPLDVAALAHAVEAPGHGAVVVFSGTVRESHAGRAVRGIHYSGYRPMAERVLAAIEADLLREHGAVVRIAHRLGELAVGEISVVIAAGAPHRAAAYDASRRALERLKAEAPIWKRELYADGSEAWREEEALADPRQAFGPPPIP